MLSGRALAQQTPTQQTPAELTLSGTLRDKAGSAVAGATVRLSPEGAATASAKTAQTDPAGHFVLSGLAAGPYQLTVILAKRSIVYPTPVQPASTPAITLTLTADDALLLAVASTQTAATGGEDLSSQAVSGLPLNKRDFSQLLLLAAGTMTDANGATNFTQQFAINGQRGVEAVFAMDGADISDPEMGGATFSNFNVDAVQEIDSSSGWLPAEVGRGAAGFTNIHTRTGADGFHGSVFEFLRNSALDARNYFDHPSFAYPGRIPPFRRNEFGFTNGGPVVVPGLFNGRKTTFYFGQYQGFRQVLGTTQVMPVPTALERTGIDQNTTLNDTFTVPVDSSIARILARYPLPNLPTGAYGAHTYATASKVSTTADQFSLRLDHHFSAKDTFFARVTIDNINGPTTNPDQTAIDPSFAVEYIDRQRNVVGSYTREATPRLVLNTLFSITRSTPGFPTPNLVDPAVKFNDGLYEAFNSAGGSVMQAYGNLFHLQQSVSYSRGRHLWKAGAEVRINRDTTYFGISPNGEYDFGGGVAYARSYIPSASGKHDIQPGQPLPDTLSQFLSGSPFVYTVAVASPGFSDGAHIGPAAVTRNAAAAYVQDTWKVTPTLTLDLGLRWDLYQPIEERARRTSSFLTINGVQQFVLNPQPGYQTNWRAFTPRVEAAWQARPSLSVHVGGSVMVIPPNIWQDNFLTGSTPFVVYPRLLSSASFPIPYGYQITPAQLPHVYTPSGQDIFANGGSTSLQPNTVMDVNRYEQDMAALTPSHVVSALNLSGIDRSFDNGTLYTWTAGLEKHLGPFTADLAYVGTTSVHLPRTSFPNAYPGASPGFAPHTQFNSAGDVIGGFGVENVITDTAHSSYHALQSSLSGTIGHGGPGIQASYTWGKSLDDTSSVIGGTGSTGATVQGFSQNPFDNHPEKGPSAFDVTHALTFTVAQDLHLEEVRPLMVVTRKATAGWELLSISSINSGSPFTVYSGIQQTGYGSNGVDRPDLIGKPVLSTARKVREDYFGLGANNGSYFSIPINLAGGSGPNSGRFGTLGRNTFRGPAFYNFDFALIKDTPFGRRHSGTEVVNLQYRAEFFNLFNIVTMGLPANILEGSGFGEISKTAGNSRQIQFSLKLIY
ncbi:MAG: TonB-dependent receptor [Acidobacteriota bacterium]|nr:TonB-dependent receptor [Acidobacteriota bacterium]